ncbi:unnamed protein product [Didymodactylos carnosus]|uniref:YihY/virulence factor BrkB family protein n=1 Tax=Didymodactylos carnosus TaxID=1234261 RepID=A0A814UDS4_9BILA|nr:unnamed protein product [Didymodactylos carnosus]CAF3934638.1 unnamed protein product [Didymodactylos carnosus]
MVALGASLKQKWDAMRVKWSEMKIWDRIKVKWDEMKIKCHILWIKFLFDWSFGYSAVIAYNLLISLVPMIAALFGILILIIGSNNNLEATIKKRIVTSFSNETREGVGNLVDMAFNQVSQDVSIVLVISIILALIIGSRLFVAIDDCLTIVYRTKERSILRQNILAIKTLLLFIILIFLMVIASYAPTILFSIIPGQTGHVLSYIAAFIVSFCLSFVLFEFIYQTIPNKKMLFKETWCGALIAGFLLELFIILFSLYTKTSTSSYIGQIGFIVILLLFFYYFGLTLHIGAQINSLFYEQQQSFPYTFGTFVQHANNNYIEKEGQKLLSRTNGDTSHNNGTS